MHYKWAFTLLLALSILSIPSLAKDPPPIIEKLGPMRPTPAPSPSHEERIRLITSFTLQNKPDGESMISFEATDLARSKTEADRTIAVELYSLVTPNPKARAVRERIIRKIRDLERDLLEYVEIVGPPKERMPQGSGSSTQRPH